MSDICILGGTGFVGTHLVTRLANLGHRVRVLTRRAVNAQHLRVLPNVGIVVCDVHAPGVLSQQFAGCDVAINLVGILNESGGAGRGFEQAHAELARKVVAAASERRVTRLLHMSSLGADATRAPSIYLRTKGVAENHVRAAPAALDWTMFRPSVIFGDGDSLLNRFAGLLRLSGGFMPLARAEARFAPIWVGDVVEAFVRALPGGETSRQSFELCGPEILTLGDLVRFTGEMIGVRARIVALPDWAGHMQATVLGLLPGKPFSTDNFRSLSLDSVCSDPGCARLGIQPASMRAVVPDYLQRRGGAADLDRYRASFGRR